MGRGTSSTFGLKEGVREGRDRERESSAGLNRLERAEQRVVPKRERVTVVQRWRAML